jgi:hypothetical protein
MGFSAMMTAACSEAADGQLPTEVAEVLESSDESTLASLGAFSLPLPPIASLELGCRMVQTRVAGARSAARVSRADPRPALPDACSTTFEGLQPVKEAGSEEVVHLRAKIAP